MTIASFQLFMVKVCFSISGIPKKFVTLPTAITK
jgi:hypothetical protein